MAGSRRNKNVNKNKKGNTKKTSTSSTSNRRKQMTTQAQNKLNKYGDNTTKFIKKTPQLIQGAVQQSVGGFRQAVAGTVSNNLDNRAKNTTGNGGITARRGGQGVSHRGSNNRNIVNDKSASKEKQEKNVEYVNRIRHSQKEGAERSSRLASGQIERGTANVEEAKQDLGKGGKYAADLLVGGVQLAGDIGIGMATGGSALPAMFVRAYGLGLDSAQKEGASGNQAMMYGLASAGMEVVTEKLGNIAAPLTKSFGKGLTDDLVDRVVKKMSKQSTTNLAYHGGKVFMAAVTEGLEEMIAEGLDPLVANAIYAEAIGKPHSTTFKDVAYAGLVGAGLGGILGGGGQIVEYNRGKKISDTATELHGEGGVKALVDKGLDIDEDAGGSTKAEAYSEMIKSGGGIAYGQVNEMARAVQEQEIRDENRFSDANNAANKEIEKQSLDNIMVVGRNEKGETEVGLTENAQGIFNENLKNNMSAVVEVQKKEQLPEMTEEQVRTVAEAIAGLQTGVVTMNDISLFTLRNPENRKILEEVMDVKLPKTNQETKTMLFEMMAEGRLESAKSQTEWRKNIVRGEILQRIAPAYESAGQDVLMDNVETINADNLEDAEMLLMGFDNAYNAGRAGKSYSEYKEIFKDTYMYVPRELREVAYAAGLVDKKSAFKSAEQVQLKLGQKVEKSRSQAKSVAHRGKLTVKLSPENKGKFGAQEQIFYKAIASAMNIEIRIVDNIDTNGFYVDGIVVLNVNGDRNLGYIFSHEITHHLQDYAPQEYQKLKELLRERWMKKDPKGYRAALEEKKSHYTSQGKTLTNEGALDEIIADGTYEFLQDENFINELCAKEHGVAQKLLDAIRMLINKIRTILANGDRFTPKQNEALYSELDILKEMESLWADALAQAVQNRSAVGTVAENASVERKSMADDEFDSFIDSLTDEEFDEVFGDLLITDIARDDSVVTKRLENFAWSSTADIMDSLREEIEEKPRYKEKTNEKGKVAKLTDERIERLFREYGASMPNYSKAYITSIHPRDFLSLTLPDELYEKWDNLVEEGTSKEFFALDLDRLREETQTPFLIIDEENGRVEGHEGRHRMRALLEAGVTEVPIAVIDYRTKYSKEKKQYQELISQQFGWDDTGVNNDARAVVTDLIPINEVNREDIMSLYGGEGDVRFSVPDTDSTGRELSEGQQEYFARSQARDEQGRLVPVYHTTSRGGFTIFDPKFSDDKISLFFSSNFNMSQTYAKGGNKPIPLDGTNEIRPEDFSLESLKQLLDDNKLFFITHDDNGNEVHTDLYGFIQDFELGKIDNIEWVSLYEDFMDMTGYEYKIVKGSKTVEEALGNLLGNFITDYYEKHRKLNGRKAGYYEVYLNLTNPMIIDGRGHNWNDINPYINGEDDVAGKLGRYAELTKMYIDREANYSTAIESLGSLSEVIDFWALELIEQGEAPLEVEVEIELRELAAELDKAYAEWDDEAHLDEDGEPTSMEEFVRERSPISMTTRQIARVAYDEGHDGVIFRNIQDTGAHNNDYYYSGDVYVAFDSNSVKAVTNLNPTEDKDIRYSLQDSDEIGAINSGTVTRYSLKSWSDTDKSKIKENLIQAGFTEQEAQNWIDDVNSVSAIIAGDKDRLDYVAADNQVMLKDNAEYYKTLDASTLCSKRLLYQGTYNAIQRAMPNTPLLADDVIRIRQMMDEAGHEVPCGICYVESRRKSLGKYASQWLESYKGEYIPTLAQVTTTDGLEQLRKEHPQTHEDFIKAMNKKGVSNPKVVELRTDYRGEVQKLTNSMIKKITHIGGLRVQSFSDFETPHLIDMMQAVIDMAGKKLTAQAYTKVPNFAWVFGGTGIKINLSLIGDVDENGNLTFDGKEGMPIEEAMAIRESYPENVGTILVGKSREHILAAMADPRIDFIIPFHHSGWAGAQYEALGLKGYKTFQSEQTEKLVKGGKPEDGDLYYNDYWDYSKTGKENAERYLAMCKEQGRVPVFSSFLVDNGDGSWSLQPDGSTDGYWKLLIDFKMYDNDGNGAPQTEVKPNFNMEEARRVLAEYDGDSNSLPIADDIVERFVDEYKGNNPKVRYSLADTAEETNQTAIDHFGETDSWEETGYLLTDGRMLDFSGKHDGAPGGYRTVDHRDIWDAFEPEGMRGFDAMMAFMNVGNIRIIPESQGIDIAVMPTDEQTEMLEDYIEYYGGEINLDIDDGKGNTVSSTYYPPNTTSTKVLSDIRKYFSTGEKPSVSEVAMFRYSLADSDDINDYVNSNETEFVDVPPTRNYEKELARVKDQSVGELKKQVEKLQAQTKLTHGKVLDPKSVAEEINMLIKALLSYNEGTKKTDHKLIKLVQENAKSIYTDVKNGNIEDAAIRAWDVATEVIENLQLINDEAYQEYKELRKYLRQTKINFPEGFPHAKEFRADNMGRLKLVKEGGRSVDDVYQELLGLYPGMFDETIDNVEDQLQEIAEVRASLEPYDIVLSEEETNQLIKETAHDILDIAVHGKPWKSWADRQAEIYDERTKKLKARHKEALRDVRAKMKDKADERVKAEKTKAKDKAEAEKMANARKQAEQKRAQQESKERKNAEAEKRRHITRIEKDLKWLSDRLLKPTDDKHLPDGYQQAIAELLMMVDPQTARSKKLEEKYGPSKKRLNFLKLKTEYEKIAKTESEGMIYNEDISNWCDELSRTLEDAGSIADATVEEMRVIRQLVRAIAHSIREQNQAFDENLKAGISELATETIHKAKTSRKTGQRGGIPGALGTLLNESMVTPRDFFEGIGGGLHKAFMSIRKGHDKHVDNITEARTFFAELFGEYANKKKPGSEIENWRNHKTNETFKLEGGTITMNVAQKMALYCSLKREQAAGHIFGSGIVVAEASTMSKLKEALGAKKEINYGTTRITMEEAYDIVSTLSSEQIEIADKLQEFLNGRCAEWGNETSLKMYGYKKFTEPNYFPIKSADVYLDSNFEGRQTVERIRNFGFTKGTVVNANNPIVIDDIFTVVADHVNKMSMYNSFAAPIADFTRVYNFRTRDEAGLVLESTKDTLANTYGKKVGRYINNFIADLQSNTQTRQEGFTRFVNKTLANYKKATIAANIRVALQQPTAIIRAFTLIDPKYFVLKNHTPSLLKKAKGEDTEYKDMLEHCPIARWKSWGFSQVDMARDIDDIMMNKEWSRLDLVTMQVYGVLDLYTWSKIWGAVRAEVRAKHPDVEVDSEEYYALCNERASEVFDKTQVVDSVIHKSQVMRNTDTMSKVLTSFMAEPTRTYNMVRSEYAQAMDMWADGDKAKATAKVARASSVYLFNALACAAAAAVADALRGKDLDGDDEEEEWYELTLANFMSNANPLNLLPVFKEVSSIWKGWDTSNMALEGIEALVKAEKGLFDKMMGNSDKSWSELFRKQAEAMGMVFGVPVKNILREIESFGKIVGIDVFAAEEGEEEQLELNLIKDGSGFDNFLNRLGINLSDTERMNRNFDKTVRTLERATKDMTAEEKQEYLWKEITRGYTTAIEEGNFAVIDNMRRLLKATGGDYQKFNESVISRTKTAMKKTIGVDVEATEEYRYQLRRLGLSDAVINQEVVMKSEAARAFQLVACEDDYDGMVETIRVLYNAGLSETELDVLYYNRTNAINANDYQTGSLIAPCNGEITSTFGYRDKPTSGASSNHQGLDIAVASNSDIVAADGGKVSSVGYSRGYGYYVKVSHGNGRYTFYAHLNGYYVQKGQSVNKGEVIALSGSTGVSTGPHLHFEVIENGVNVDPLPYLQ